MSLDRFQDLESDAFAVLPKCVGNFLLLRDREQEICSNPDNQVVYGFDSAQRIFVAAAVCRELTKTHEEVRRGPLADLVTWAADGVRGEVTLVVSGAVPTAAVGDTPAELRAAVADHEAAGSTRKEAILEIARLAGVPKRVVYDAVHKPQED